jgi:hypothetical protein
MNGKGKIRQQYQEKIRGFALGGTSLLLRQPPEKHTLMNPTLNKEINAAHRFLTTETNRRRHCCVKAPEFSVGYLKVIVFRKYMYISSETENFRYLVGSRIYYSRLMTKYLIE